MGSRRLLPPAPAFFEITDHSNNYWSYTSYSSHRSAKPTGASGEVWGSLLLVGENLYVVNRSGDTIVFKANPERLELVATNPLKELSNSTPAIADGDLFIRTHNALWCIGEGRRASGEGRTEGNDLQTAAIK